MNPANNINYGNQTENTYITFFSGWPTNLVVKYNHNTDKNELINYPQYDELDKDTFLDTFPYMTDEYKQAAKKAKSGQDMNQEATNMLPLTLIFREELNPLSQVSFPQKIQMGRMSMQTGILNPLP